MRNNNIFQKPHITQSREDSVIMQNFITVFYDEDKYSN
jgi:hypothetical protein